MRKHWIKGHIYLGNLTQHSAQYVAGYVTKKLTSIGHDYKDILHGRYPEFGRQSKMPGLGLEAVLKHAEKIKPHIKTVDDIPKFLLHGGKKWPLGRYLQGKLNEALGYEEEEVSKAKREKSWQDTMLSMFEGKELTAYQKVLVRSGS